MTKEEKESSASHLIIDLSFDDVMDDRVQKSLTSDLCIIQGHLLF